MTEEIDALVNEDAGIWCCGCKVGDDQIQADVVMIRPDDYHALLGKTIKLYRIRELSSSFVVQIPTDLEPIHTEVELCRIRKSPGI